MATTSRPVPPGQSATRSFPVLHEGAVPAYDMAQWDLVVDGVVDRPLRFTYRELLALPRVALVADIHCVTHWTSLDRRWEGLSFAKVVELARPRPEARFVRLVAEGGYDTCHPVTVPASDGSMVAYRLDGAPLPPIHGGPVRFVCPSKYFWKSPKWLRRIEFRPDNLLGYWETRGYHDGADPWTEERFA